MSCQPIHHLSAEGHIPVDGYTPFPKGLPRTACVSVELWIDFDDDLKTLLHLNLFNLLP